MHLMIGFVNYSNECVSNFKTVHESYLTHLKSFLDIIGRYFKNFSKTFLKNQNF